MFCKKVFGIAKVHFLNFHFYLPISPKDIAPYYWILVVFERKLNLKGPTKED